MHILIRQVIRIRSLRQCSMRPTIDQSLVQDLRSVRFGRKCYTPKLTENNVHQSDSVAVRLTARSSVTALPTVVRTLWCTYNHDIVIERADAWLCVMSNVFSQVRVIRMFRTNAKVGEACGRVKVNIPYVSSLNTKPVTGGDVTNRQLSSCNADLPFSVLRSGPPRIMLSPLQTADNTSKSFARSDALLICSGPLLFSNSLHSVWSERLSALSSISHETSNPES